MSQLVGQTRLMPKHHQNTRSTSYLVRVCRLRSQKPGSRRQEIFPARILPNRGSAARSPLRVLCHAKSLAAAKSLFSKTSHTAKAALQKCRLHMRSPTVRLLPDPAARRSPYPLQSPVQAVTLLRHFQKNIFCRRSHDIFYILRRLNYLSTKYLNFFKYFFDKRLDKTNDFCYNIGKTINIVTILSSFLLSRRSDA